MLHTINYKSTFPMVLQKYVDLKGIKKYTTMCRGIGMKPDTFSAIIRGKYKNVERDNVLKICIGLKLHLDEAEELLKSARLGFSDGDMTDIVIKSFLWNRCYNVIAINAELVENGEPILFKNFKIDYEPQSFLSQSTREATATKPVTARHSRDFLRDTSQSNQKSINIRLQTLKERSI